MSYCILTDEGLVFRGATPPSFKKLLDTLYEIVVVEKWTGEVKIQLHRGGVRHIRRVLTPEEIEVILVDDKGM
jgi:hypothetical protein|tara:strand:- start:199 stop:417 length:219 start_codon:yes stop_codon:yes gene_type:complete